MTSFSDQLASTRANLEKLERIAAECPDLLEHGHLIDVAPEGSKVFLHASSQPLRDWLALARKYPAGWQREQSASYQDKWDWSGKLGNVDVCIIGAETKPEPQSLFAEEVVA